MLTEIFGGVSALTGLLGASAAARREQAQREALLAQMRREIEGDYLSEAGLNSRNLYSQAGLGGDAIRALGSRLGDSLAGSGVYNSSAVGGALVQGQRDQSSQLADLAARLQGNALHRKQAAMGQLRGMQLSFADQSAQNARNDLTSARGGLSSFLGSLVQNNLMKSGANAPRVALNGVNGLTNQGANLPGNAGLNLTPSILPRYDWRKALDLRSTPMMGRF